MSASSRCVHLLEKSEGSLKSDTDRERVKRLAVERNAGDPIPYDSEDGPYDPNEEEATEKHLRASIEAGLVTRGPGKRGPQKAPTRKLVCLRLSQPVLNHFRATGPGLAGTHRRRSEEGRRRIAAASCRRCRYRSPQPTHSSHRNTARSRS